MAALTMPVVGQVVAFQEDDYAFKDDDTGREMSGTSRTIWITTGFTSAPTSVKLKAEGHEGVAQAIREAGAGAFISLTAVVRARREQVVLTLDTVGEIKPSGGK